MGREDQRQAPGAPQPLCALLVAEEPEFTFCCTSPVPTTSLSIRNVTNLMLAVECFAGLFVLLTDYGTRFISSLILSADVDAIISAPRTHRLHHWGEIWDL